MVENSNNGWSRRRSKQLQLRAVGNMFVSSKWRWPTILQNPLTFGVEKSVREESGKLSFWMMHIDGIVRRNSSTDQNQIELILRNTSVD